MLILALKGHPRRNMGMFIEEGHFVVHRDYDAHLLRKTHSYGMNYALIKHPLEFGIKKISLHETRNGATIALGPYDPAYLLKKAVVMHFKEQGFELQAFIHRSAFTIENAATVQNIQLDLF
jgi:hypothetical protein